MGRKLSATLLTQSLNHVMNSSGKLRRRILAEIYQMLKKGEYHYGRDLVNHEIKMIQYRRFLEKQKNQAISQKIA
jgi:hypothetical protein